MNLRALLSICSDDDTRLSIQLPYYHEHDGRKYLAATNGALLMLTELPQQIVPLPCNGITPPNVSGFIKQIEATPESDNLLVFPKQAVRKSTFPFRYMFNGVIFGSRVIHTIAKCCNWQKITFDGLVDRAGVFSGGGARFLLMPINFHSKSDPEWVWDFESNGFIHFHPPQESK